MVNAVVIVLCLVVLGWAAALVTVPRWFFRSLHRHRLWKLHDALVKEILDGHLPGDNPAVRELRSLILVVVNENVGTRMLDHYVFRGAMRGMAPLSKKQLLDSAKLLPLDGLDQKQADVLREYRGRFLVLFVGSLLLGSWIGLLTVLRFVPAGIAEAKRIRREQRCQNETPASGTRLVLREATDEAAEQSRLGRHYREVIEKDPLRELAF